MPEAISYPFSDEGVKAALAALGTTENAVATNLYSLGFRGVQGSESQDPLGRYLVASVKDAAHAEVIVEVGSNGEAYAILRTPNREEVAADLPPHVRTFILRFDDGKHPDLIEGAAA